jgi:hypothetical protein
MPSIAMRAARRRSIEANLFPDAHAAIEAWDDYRWHGAAGEVCDAYKEKSSQALSIDVFGTLKVHPGRERVLDALAEQLGLPAGGPWAVALEWHDPDNVLAEKQPTWVDAMARSPQALILFECKFTEHDGGSCSQTKPLSTGPRRGTRQCSGEYRLQPNPANGKLRMNRCALTAKKIRYWDVIPEVFGYDAGLDYAPCPFAGSWFQWMRNLATCAAVSRQQQVQPAFVVVYADGPGLPMAARVRSAEWQWLEARINPAAIKFRAMSYQALLTLAQASAPGDPVWPALAAWVARKVTSVCGIQSWDYEAG